MPSPTRFESRSPYHLYHAGVATVGKRAEYLGIGIRAVKPNAAVYKCKVNSARMPTAEGKHIRHDILRAIGEPKPWTRKAAGGR